VIVTAFIVIIVGGVGSLEGAILASVVYAFVHTFVTTFYGGVIADITGLSLMLLVLIVKPTGLFGCTDRALIPDLDRSWGSLGSPAPRPQLFATRNPCFPDHQRPCGHVLPPVDVNR